MSRIFISYRREDASAYAGRLLDRLKLHFGRDRVFMDIDTIEPGMDFVEAIEQAVGSCEALIALIGRQWLSATDAKGRHRLDNPEDYHRLEITTALNRKIRVIPVLVGGATMPGSDELPEALRPLARRHALEVSDTRWDFDVGRLIETLEKVVTKAGAAGKASARELQPGVEKPADTQSQPPVDTPGVTGPIAAASDSVNINIKKVSRLTYQWAGLCHATVDEARQLCEKALQALPDSQGVTAKGNSTLVAMSPWNMLLVNGKVEVRIDLEPIGQQQTLLTITSRETHWPSLSFDVDLGDGLNPTKDRLREVIQSLTASGTVAS